MLQSHESIKIAALDACSTWIKASMQLYCLVEIENLVSPPYAPNTPSWLRKMAAMATGQMKRMRKRKMENR